MGRGIGIGVGHWSVALGIDTEVRRVKQLLVLSLEAAIGTRRIDPARHARNNLRILEVTLQTGVIPADRIESKPMPSNWEVGKKLGFEIRIRPIVRPTKNAESRPGRECDAFQLEAERYERGDMPRSREQVYYEWLARQFENRGGATLKSATLQSFQRTRAIRKQRSRYSEGPDALMRGTLTVTDGAAFAKLLAGGVGRHRAYGYGMLLLRPAG